MSLNIKYVIKEGAKHMDDMDYTQMYLCFSESYIMNDSKQ